MLVAGADDCGRGCVFGGMFICAFAIDDSKEGELRKLGVKDSKMLSPEAREKLYPKLIKMGDYAVVEYSAEKITMLMRRKVSFNTSEAAIRTTRAPSLFSRKALTGWKCRSTCAKSGAASKRTMRPQGRRSSAISRKTKKRILEKEKIEKKEKNERGKTQTSFSKSSSFFFATRATESFIPKPIAIARPKPNARDREPSNSRKAVRSKLASALGRNKGKAMTTAV